ncbi:MAG: ATP-binding cassette domain-containing protein [bacterium]|nr:ATP-binding cassette domain-containing protein [bacterium]
MLKLENITKVYTTKKISQTALKGVSLTFRESEFVSILGPSGSGKTTLLNIIGGLDKYTNGDLIINSISTKKYSDKDWDTYRNHKIGFIFQNYNLIPHQTILANVEIALTLSGISKKERRKRSIKALNDVGLKEHIKKKPNMLSGGQMQRVAIARALVNNPDIVLADEPTGALDTKTSIQIMDLLKNISKDKLVIMVTHNSELAEKYSNRIINIKDGEITRDSNPFNNNEEKEKIVKRKRNKTMNFITALSLSLNNLLTKKSRTFLTSFASSIGIIGIALILSLSKGATKYIDRTERETLASYPISIEKDTIDYNSFIKNTQNNNNKDIYKCNKKSICTFDDLSNNPYLQMTNKKVSNNLKEFKFAIENNYENIFDYVIDIKYNYNVKLELYDKENYQKISNSMFTNEEMKEYLNTSDNTFKELISDEKLLKSQYELLIGKYPEKYNELVLVVNKDGKVPMSLMYTLNYEDKSNLNEVLKSDEIKSINYNYNSLLNKTYKLVLPTDYYQKMNNIWVNKIDDNSYLKNIINNGQDIKIVGILKVSSDAVNADSGFVGYTKDLAMHIINEINNSKIAQEQINNKNKNVFTSLPFDDNISYETNAMVIGINDISNPSSISIYPKNFDSKEKIVEIIQKYNKNISDEDKITYTDYVKILMSGITNIIDVITYILIAFVAISLIVSSIMIAIITYISVLERTKEIGILRAIGASKKDISRVFNAETIIEGFISGVFGIIITILLNKVVDTIVYNISSVSNITHLAISHAIILIIISVFLTFIAGLIPAKIASKKDPVVALRSE